MTSITVAWMGPVERIRDLIVVECKVELEMVNSFNDRPKAPEWLPACQFMLYGLSKQYLRMVVSVMCWSSEADTGTEPMELRRPRRPGKKMGHANIATNSPDQTSHFKMAASPDQTTRSKLITSPLQQTYSDVTVSPSQVARPNVPVTPPQTTPNMATNPSSRPNSNMAISSDQQSFSHGMLVPSTRIISASNDNGLSDSPPALIGLPPGNYQVMRPVPYVCEKSRAP